MGVVLLIASTVGGYSVYQSRPVVEHSVLIAARDVAPGTVLSRDDLDTRSVVVDDAWLASLVPAGELGSLVGRAAPEPLHAGMPVERAQVAPRELLAAGEEAIELPVEPTAVANGEIHVGDWVQVWATAKASGAHAQSVLDRARVIDIDYERGGRTNVGGSSVAKGSPTGLVLALRPEQARAVTEAYRTGSVDVARLPAGAGADQ